MEWAKLPDLNPEQQAASARLKDGTWTPADIDTIEKYWLRCCDIAMGLGPFEQIEAIRGKLVSIMMVRLQLSLL